MSSENSSKVHYVTVSAQEAGQRVDNFIRARYPALPKGRIYQMLRKGEVRVNKKRAKPVLRLQAGDVLRLPPIVAGKTPLVRVPAFWLERIEAARLYEDEDFLVLNKPAGIAVHGGSGQDFGVIDAVKIIWGEDYAQLAHRLDFDTSGALLLGKHRRALAGFQQAMQADAVIKVYDCLLKGSWDKASQEVVLRMKKEGERVVVAEDGKFARTFFTLQKWLEYEGCALSWVKARLDTGRTHQIRVSVAAQGAPLAGDDKYGDWAFNRWLKSLGYHEMFLHSCELAFDYEGKRIAVYAPLPESAMALLARLGA
ncbi:pseudouridine synthase [Rappaport israeli]|uniref:pseudouridine synthase n=1 Tax=Rappaport israeli TaxID=1839807 RepID=UPI0009305B7E|nr:pseudouridine synthase [Rappaport israeli]